MKKTLYSAAIMFSITSAPAYSAGFVRFFEGNHCTQNSVGEVEVDRYRSISFKKDPYLENDEARSVKLFDLKKGTIVRLYDSPEGKTNDDWVSIELKRNITELCVGTFERSVRNSTLTISFHRNNGLDGKVSYIRAYPAD